MMTDPTRDERDRMFPQLSPAQIERVRAFATERTFEDGAVVIEQGEASSPFFVVLEGSLVVVVPEGGLERPVTEHQVHEFSGEISSLAERRAIVRLRAKGRVRALAIPHDKFRSLVQTDSDLGEVVLRAFILRRLWLIGAGYGDAIVVGSKNNAATLQLQEFLIRSGQPVRYVDVEEEENLQQFLDTFHIHLEDIPVLICRGERVLKNPTESEVAECLGFNAGVDLGTVRDVVICGAGPGGLAAAVYGASEGLDTVVIERRSPGGQAASSSAIENYFGFPLGLSGQILVSRGLIQAEKFGAHLMVADGGVRLHCDETPLRLELANGESIRTRAVVIATGAEYRKLQLDDVARFEGVGIYYSATTIEAKRCSTDEVIVVGGGNSAGQAAMFLSRTAKHVHLLIRGPSLAASMSRYLIRRIEEAPNVTLRPHTEIVALEGEQHLEHVTWQQRGGERLRHAIRHVFTMAGAAPNTAWLRGCVELDEKGFVVTGVDLSKESLDAWPDARSPYLFETSQPRVFAVGDVRSRSVKRVASAVGEGSVCIQLVHQALAE